MKDFELTKVEKDFVRKLKAATKCVPPRLALLCMESGLHVVHRDGAGDVVFTTANGYDPDYVVATITDDVLCGAW